MQENDGSSSEEDNCTVVFQNHTRKDVKGEKNLSLLDFLAEGRSELSLSSTSLSTDMVIILGNSGCGKTTLTQMIAGDLTKLHTKKTENGQIVIEDEYDRISAVSTTSRTLVPEAVSSINGSIQYLDCPGFNDNRGALQDLAANYFTNQALNNIPRVKLLFLVKSDGVRAGDRNEFDSLAGHAVTFLKNPKLFESSIGLIVTKVYRNSGIGGKRLKDTHIKNGIVAFLQKYVSDKEDMLAAEQNEHRKLELTKKILFVRTLLQPTDNNGTKITFSVSPEKCGRLDSSEDVQQTKGRVARVIENLEFTPVGNVAENFGFTLGDNTKLAIINKYTAEVTTAVVNQFKGQLNEFIDWYETSFSQALNNTKHTREKLVVVWGHVDNLSLTENTDNPLTSAKELRSWFNDMGFSSGEALIEFMSEKLTYFEFFDRAVGHKTDRKSILWITSIKTVYTKLITQTNKAVIQLVSRINVEVEKDIRSFLSSIDTFVEGQFKGMNLSEIVNTVTNLYGGLNGPLSHANSVLLADNVTATLIPLGFQKPTITISNLQERENLLKLIKTTLSLKHLRGTSLVPPVSRIQEELFKQMNHRVFPLLSRISKDLEEDVPRFASSIEDFLKEKFKSMDTTEISEIITSLYSGLRTSQAPGTIITILDNLMRTLRRLGFPEPTHITSKVYEWEKLSNLIRGNGNNVMSKEPPLMSIAGQLTDKLYKQKDQQVIQLASRITKEIEDDITAFSTRFETFLENKFKLMNITEAVNTVSKLYTGLRTQSFTDITSFFNNIMPVLQSFGFQSLTTMASRTRQREDLLKEIKRRNVHVAGLSEISPALPANQLEDKLYRLKNWYEFNLDAERALGSYSFQKLALKKPANLKMSWVEFLESEAKVVVPTEIAEIGNSFRSRNSAHFDSLYTVMEAAFDPMRTQCFLDDTNEVTLLTTGRNVVLTKVLSEKYRLSCQSPKSVEIYSTEKLFIDTNIRAKGEKMNVVFVAPYWEVVDNAHIVDLSGTNGADPSIRKSHNGIMSYNQELRNGGNGLAGIPGGPGGNFLGIFNKIANSSLLRIDTGGGDGGRGMDGGDGAVGMDGYTISTKEHHFSGWTLLGASSSTKGWRPTSGGAGGNGGNGGVGGRGGISGSVTFYPNGQGHITVSKENGRKGEDGWGGQRAYGGKGASGKICEQNRFIGIQVARKCRWPTENDGLRGENGVTGGSYFSYRDPNLPKTSYSTIYAKYYQGCLIR